MTGVLNIVKPYGVPAKLVVQCYKLRMSQSASTHE